MLAAAQPVTQPSTSSPSDEVLVGQVLAGEPEAFAPIMRRYNQRLYRVARAILRDANEAEDVVQHAYLLAYAHLHQYAGRAALSTWLTRIVVHEAFARMEKLKRARGLTNGESAPPWCGGLHAVHSPEDHASQAELGRMLEAAIDALPESCRTSFVLREIEGLSTLETAESLAISEEAVRIRLFRARALLRRSLSERAQLAAHEVFSIGGERCNKLVASVLARIEPVRALA